MFFYVDSLANVCDFRYIKPTKEKPMRKIVTTLKATIALSCLIGAATGGFVAGGYWTGQKMEKAAIAHECASLDPATLAFRWRLPITMDMAMAAMPDVAPIRKPVKGGK